MLDFLWVSCEEGKKNEIHIKPEFIMIYPSKDLMIRAGDFYAVWVEELGLWSTSEQYVINLVDAELKKKYDEVVKTNPDSKVIPHYMWKASSGSIDRWHKYCQDQMRDSFEPLDEKIIFANDPVDRKDYASKRLKYSIQNGDLTGWNTIIGTLYSPEERHKIEWAIGAIVTGDSKYIQKFLVFYGSAGTGKSTILNIIQDLFKGYYCTFDAKTLGASGSQFAMEQFRDNPLVAIQHDGDLSKIEDNTRINSLVSHEEMMVNTKHKSAYSARFKCFLFMGTNKPVKITDAKSGIIRRLIDVHPSGNLLAEDEYDKAMNLIQFELGAIAYHCREVYLENPNYYSRYKPLRMMEATNDFYDFVCDKFRIFANEDSVSVKSAWAMYKEYCEESLVPYKHSLRIFREELKNYFRDFDGTSYSGFKKEIFEISKNPGREKRKKQNTWLEFKEQESIFDKECSGFPAQYATEEGTPSRKWIRCKTKLSDIDSSKLHFVKFPEEHISHIVVDFDIPDENGNKCLEKNLEEANKWPPTYAELSKSGEGIHLHYIYDGDPNKLSRVYAEHVEIKVYSGDSSLRRKLSKCNDISIAHINSGLPLKGEKVINSDVIKSERSLRTLIERNLNKEIHPGTKPSIDFIYKILEDAYESGLHYDISDMENEIFAFAAMSTNKADYCIKLVNKMKFKSEDAALPDNSYEPAIIFYDIEIFPNLFIVNWKFEGKDKPVVRMINPKASDIEELIRFRLIGFNCRKYDNHLIYARLMGYSNEELYRLSQRIITENDRNAFFREAYNISYTDVYDFAAKKQSLKKWEIELGIHHQELGLPWDQPVDESLWDKVAEYCDNDVIATEAVFEHLQGDFTARKILAKLSGLTVNDTTNSHTTKIIFGNEKHPKLVYTDLSELFPGYEHAYSEKDKKFHNMYRGDDVGHGGYVYSEPGIYTDVALLDVASMHPTSIEKLKLFGDYTKRFSEIKQARIYIKRGELDKARTMLDGKLAPYLDDESMAKDLAQALKIAINSVYGLTSASFDNPFRDPRNTNNIVALRGALFMRTLQDEVKARGFTVAHIKVDSIKIPNATPEIIQFCMDFAKSYGYEFEHEATYERMCLINDTDYIAKYEDGKHAGEWTATGKRFSEPYIFKTLFSKKPITFNDLCRTFSVSKGDLYLDFNEKLDDVSTYEKQLEKAKDDYKKGKLSDMIFEAMTSDLRAKIEKGHDYQFVGRVGQFCPVKEGCGGGVLYRINDGKTYAASGSTGYRWLESEVISKSIEGETDSRINEDGEVYSVAKRDAIGDAMEIIDREFFRKMVDEAADLIAKFGDVDRFVSDDPYISDDFMNYPEEEEVELPFI